MIIKTSMVIPDEYTEAVARAFDYEFAGKSTFIGYDRPAIPSSYNIGVIFGASGTGKTSLLSEFGSEEIPEWNSDKAIISHFSTSGEGIDRLSAVGLNSIPSWCKPYHVLSTGEKFRADLARKIRDGAIIDEFTSVVDRNVAKAASVSVAKYIRQRNIQNVIFASCHKDILEYLEPDWTFNTDSGELLVGRFLRRPEIKIDIFRCGYSLWRMFAKHHYLNGNLNRSSRCFVGMWGEEIVSFNASLAYPNGNFKNAWREHRTVVLPDYQGMGIGTRFSDAIAQIFINQGKRYFSRTAHIRMGEYRNKSSLWRATSKNMIARKDINQAKFGKYHGWTNDSRITYSHEYIGQ